MWQPDAAACSQVVAMLEQAQTPDSATQAALTAQLEQLQTVPEFNQTLAHVFIRLKDRPVAVRMGAGLILKNNIRRHLHAMSPELAAALKSEILQGVTDDEVQVRRTVGTCVSTLACGMGHDQMWLELWPDLMPALTACLGPSAPPVAIDGALDCLSKICEEVPDRMCADASKPLDVILPLLFGYLTSENDAFRIYSLGIMNQFIILDPKVMSDNIATFLQAIFHLCSDPSPGVRKHVCQAINLLIEVRFGDVLPHINGVIEFMLHSMKDPDSSVALDAVDFWSAIADNGSHGEQTRAIDTVRPYLPQLVPLLLDGMVYDENDPSMEFQDDDDAHLEDKLEDIAPVHGKRDAEEDDEDNEGETSWNLRKGSAGALDLMATVFKNELLQYLMPLLEQLLQAEDWHRRESGILAIGAIADGCRREVSEHMGTLMPYMLTTVDDPKPLIRSISCWSMSRYSRWVAGQSQDVLGAVLGKFGTRCLDNNKRVQEAAVSALAVLEETTGPAIEPFIGSIVQVVVACFAKYKAKNLLILFDVVATLAEAVRSKLAQPDVVAILMPPILAKWEQLGDEDQALIPCTECLSALVGVMGPLFLPFVEPLYARALRIVHARTAQVIGRGELTRSDFAVVSLDMISSMLDALGSQLTPLVVSSDTITLLIGAAQADPSSEMKRVLFAVMGDLAKSCWEVLQPHCETVLSLLSQNLNPYSISVCNNATWSIGIIAMKQGSSMDVSVCAGVVACLSRVLNDGRRNHKSLLDTSSKALGQLGLVLPAVVAEHVDNYLIEWCKALRNCYDDEEKEHATLAVLRSNPAACAPHIGYVCDVFCSWNKINLEARPAMAQGCSETLNSFKMHLGDQWPLLWQSLHVNVQTTLTEIFRVSI